jgi:hypothetical protein
MQLKIKRSQKKSLMGGSVIFCVDAMVAFAQAEADAINKYKLGSQIIYSSEAAKRHAAAIGVPRARVDHPDWDRASRVIDGASQSAFGALMNIGHAALAAMNLNITISSLSNGQHIECKSLDEVMGAEAALVDACTNLRAYLDVAATFDGTERVVKFEAQPVV